MSNLQLLPLGGMGNVTQNMYLYEYEDEILLVDCGIGFPTTYMPGIDILVPDITPLLKKLEAGKKIVGMILTHGHDDHIAALSYVLPHLPEFPIFGSPLTIGFAQERVSELNREVEFRVVETGKEVRLSPNFGFTSYNMTHSVPDTRHLLITTPVGSIYHGSDFKIDPRPVDGAVSDLESLAKLGEQGVLCVLLDCLRVEKNEPAEPESTIGAEFEKLMANTKGKFILTLMSSHIHRIQQAVDVAQKLGRKVVFVGRSVEQNVRVARDLGKLKVRQDQIIDKKQIDTLPDNQVCLIIAGSQGQEGSSLVRAIFGEHPALQIKADDTVVFSADAIPGNEVPYYQSIDELAGNDVRVLYPAIEPGLHHSGHASKQEQRQVVELLKPKLVMPIGGADRHRYLFAINIARLLGYSGEQILRPRSGETVVFTQDGASIGSKFELRPTTVDGLGIGDVGPVVLSDRLKLGDAGIVAVIVPRVKGELKLDQIQLISRGFVFMQKADEVIEFIKQTVRDAISQNKNLSDKELGQTIEKRLVRKLYKIIKREPLVIANIVSFKA